MALVSQELRRNRTSFISYCVAVVLFVWMYVALYPTIEDQAESLNQFLESLPQGFMQAFGMDGTGFDSIEGYLTTELMSFVWPLLAIFLVLSRAGTAIAGAIENLTIGLELSLPTSRTRLYFSKYGGGLIIIAAFCAVSMYSMPLIAWMYGYSITLSGTSALVVLCFLFAASLYSLGFCVSAYASEKSRVYFLVGSFALVSYIGNLVANMNDSLSWIKHFSVMNYFDVQYSFQNGSVELSAIFFYLGIIIVTTIIGWREFRQRDISV